MTAWEILEAAGSHMRDRAATYDSPAGERSMAKPSQCLTRWSART
jgi:hypothetical protein